MECRCGCGCGDELDEVMQVPGGPAEGMQRLDLVFVHLKRGGPILGEMVRRGKGEIGIHVISGPRNKVGQILVVPTNHLQPYKVSSMQLRGAFPPGKMPEELLEKGTAYLITDKPTMYPDFTNAQWNLGGSTVAQDRQSPTPNASQGEDPNAALARDIVKQGQARGDQEQPRVPLSLGLRRRFVNPGV